MIEFFAQHCLNEIQHLEGLFDLVPQILANHAGAKDRTQYKKTIRALITAIGDVEKRADDLKLTETKGRCEQFKQTLEFGLAEGQDIFTSLIRREISQDEARSEIAGILNAFKKEMRHRKFVYIPPEKEKYFNKKRQSALFGAVSLTFSDAAEDIMNAGNSLAADLYDAAAFYLMRVVEVGLRKLAKKLRVSFPKTPLEYAGWKAIVKAIDEKLEFRMPKARGKKQAAALQFKHDLLVDFKAFEVARNEIMHGRSRYNEQEATGLFNRVDDFMNRLANNI
jgi:hypothetical protein